MIVAHDNYAKIIEGARKLKLIQPSNFEGFCYSRYKCSQRSY